MISLPISFIRRSWRCDSPCSLPSWLLIAIVVCAALVVPSAADAAGTWSGPDAIDPAIYAPAVSCSSSFFCVAVGFASSYGSVAIYRDGNWSEAELLDPHGQFTSVSCPTSLFCMALDGGGRSYTYNGSTWGAPVQLGTDLTAVSCVSSSFCVGIGGPGDASIYDGSSWSTPETIGLSGARSISCVSESFCMAIGGAGYAVTYNGSSWSTPVEMDSQYESGVSSVSCGSSTFCVAVGNFGDEETYSEGKWSAPNSVGKQGYIGSVSCHSDSFCVALSPGGEAVVFKNGEWTSIPDINPSVSSGAVACTSESFCLAVGGYAAIYDGSSWGRAVPVGSGSLDAVSCSTRSFCAAVDGHGRTLTYDGSNWTTPRRVFTDGSLNSVSCPVSSFCAAVGGNEEKGYALIYDGATWSSPTEVDNEGLMQSVSCVSSTFCVAVTQHGREGAATTYAVRYNGVGWSAPVEVDSHGVLSSLSCAAETFCMAAGGHEAAIFNGSSWTSPATVYAEGNINAVSCVSASFCEAMAEHYVSPGWSTGQGLVYDGATWSAPSEIPRAPERGPFIPGSVSCPTSTLCVAGARFESAVAFDEAGAWTPWTPLEINAGFTSISCPITTFCAAVNVIGQVYTYSAPEQASPPSKPTNPIAHTPHGIHEHGKPFVNHKTGVITLRYSFSSPGLAQAIGEMVHKCESRHGKKRHTCVNHALGYRRSRLAVNKPGIYTMRLRPDKKTLGTLKRGATLTERVTITFLPSGTHTAVRQNVTVKIKLVAARTRK